MKGKFTKYQIDKCMQIIDKVVQLPVSQPFIKKVDPLKDGIRDYLDIIKMPMSFDVIKSKLSSYSYKEMNEFIQDVELIWENAKTYNGEDSEVYLMAREASLYFNKHIKNLPNSVEEEWIQKLQKISLKLYKAFKMNPLLAQSKDEGSHSAPNDKPNNES